MMNCTFPLKWGTKELLRVSQAHHSNRHDVPIELINFKRTQQFAMIVVGYGSRLLVCAPIQPQTYVSYCVINPSIRFHQPSYKLISTFSEWVIVMSLPPREDLSPRKLRTTGEVCAGSRFSLLMGPPSIPCQDIYPPVIQACPAGTSSKKIRGFFQQDDCLIGDLGHFLPLSLYLYIYIYWEE